MPVHQEKRGEKYRIVDPDGSITKNNAGTPVDGGGHDSKADAVSQVQAINLNMRRESSVDDSIINRIAIKIF